MIKAEHLQNPASYFFFAGLLLLDSMDLFDRGHDLNELSHFACYLLPFTKLSSLFVPGQLASYANSQCMPQATEPGISIIFFMFKIILVLITVLILCIWTLSANFQTYQEKFFKRIADNGSFWKSAKEEVILLLGLSGAYIYCCLQLDKSPLKFRTDIFPKSFEDFLCLILLCALSGTLAVCCFYTSYVLTKSKTFRQ